MTYQDRITAAALKGINAYEFTGLVEADAVVTEEARRIANDFPGTSGALSACTNIIRINDRIEEII
jgi:hypothetical protein